MGCYDKETSFMEKTEKIKVNLVMQSTNVRGQSGKLEYLRVMGH